MRNGIAHILVFLLALAGCAPVDSGEVFDDLELGDSLPSGADPKADGFTVPSSLHLDKHGILYLTFDDGPSPSLTPKVLDILKAHGIKATFFITGASIAGNEDLIRRAAAEGHTIASHQWKHVQASQAEFRTWVRQERELLRELVSPDMPLFFRYPFGAAKSWKETILKEEGYQDGGIGWDIDSLDWSYGSDGHTDRSEVPVALRNDMDAWVLKQVDARGGGVILFHDIQSITVAHLPGLIAAFKARGYRFAPIARGEAKPEVFIGSACAQDEDCRFEGGLCWKEGGAERGVCTMACEGSCPDRAGFPVTRCVAVASEENQSVGLCAATCSDACTGECTDLPAWSGDQTRNVCWP